MSIHWYDVITWMDLAFAFFVVMTCLLCGVVGALFVLAWSDRKQHGTEDDQG